jgi:ribose/xylose/arabinose/galactoside ABC-type transport system permease subunit
MFVKTPYFASLENIVNLFTKIAIEGVIVIGMTYLIILGEIDLSVGETMALSCTLSVILQKFGVIPGVLGGLLIGIVIGFFNGWIVVRLRVASIAATLGMMILVNGIVYVITKSLAPAGGNYSISGHNENFALIASTKFLGIPTMIIIFVVLVFVFDLILKRTVYGRNVFATGGNYLASRYANIRVNRIRLSAFVITGALSGLAGVLLVARYNIASGAIGQSIPLFVITAVLLGGVSLSGGEGSVFKAFWGLLLVGVIDNSLMLLKVYSSVKFMIMGVLLILMLVIDGIYINRMKYE